MAYRFTPINLPGLMPAFTPVNAVPKSFAQTDVMKKQQAEAARHNRVVEADWARQRAEAERAARAEEAFNAAKERQRILEADRASASDALDKYGAMAENLATRSRGEAGLRAGGIQIHPGLSKIASPDVAMRKPLREPEISFGRKDDDQRPRLGATAPNLPSVSLGLGPLDMMLPAPPSVLRPGELTTASGEPLGTYEPDATFNRQVEAVVGTFRDWAGRAPGIDVPAIRQGETAVRQMVASGMTPEKAVESALKDLSIPLAKQYHADARSRMMAASQATRGDRPNPSEAFRDMRDMIRLRHVPTTLEIFKKLDGAIKSFNPRNPASIAPMVNMLARAVSQESGALATGDVTRSYGDDWRSVLEKIKDWSTRNLDSGVSKTVAAEILSVAQTARDALSAKGLEAYEDLAAQRDEYAPGGPLAHPRSYIKANQPLRAVFGGFPWYDELEQPSMPAAGADDGSTSESSFYMERGAPPMEHESLGVTESVAPKSVTTDRNAARNFLERYGKKGN